MVTHVLFEDSRVKWLWEEDELIRFREMWNEGAQIHDIAKEFKTNKKSIVLLVMESSRRRND